jgi:hypoxanthine phosphoribosyltransferase
MHEAGIGREERYEGIERVLITREQIATRVRELAQRIAEIYAGKELTLLAILTGSVMFLADLMRELPMRMRLDVMSVSSYPGDAVESQGPKVLSAPLSELKDRHVLLMDDILDTGQTLEAIARRVRRESPASLRTCVLLQKNRPSGQLPFHVDFVGFQVPHEFVVGYGLDYDHLYRNLSEICVLNPQAFQGAT